MKRLMILFFALCCLVFTAKAQTSFEFTCENKQLETETDFNGWIKKEVFWISTNKEKEEFSKLTSNKEKIAFINNFWLRRDPDPNTPKNEFKTGYCERIGFTGKFDSGIPGWRTDRGLIYILYGKPDKIEKGRTNFEKLENILFEKWFYKSLPGEKANTEFTFFDPTESNEFRLEKAKREELLKNLGNGLSICFNCPQSKQSINKNLEIQLTPFGYISLPKGYWAYMDADYMDAWAGYIESLDGIFKVGFRDGIIVSVFEGKDQSIKWRKELKTENNLISYALSDDGKTKLVLAKIKSANFSAQIQTDSDIDKFLEIISQYKTGRCEKCFNSHYTKGMKKYFEKLNKND